VFPGVAFGFGVGVGVGVEVGGRLCFTLFRTRCLFKRRFMMELYDRLTESTKQQLAAASFFELIKESWCLITCYVILLIKKFYCSNSPLYREQ